MKYLLLLLALTFSAFGAERIETAFGIKLGAPFPKAIALAFITNGPQVEVIFGVTNVPTYFDMYRAACIGSSNVVVSIQAAGGFTSEKAREKAFGAIKSILDSKYLMLDGAEAQSSNWEYVILQKERVVILRKRINMAAGSRRYYLDLVYTNRERYERLFSPPSAPDPQKIFDIELI